MNVRVRSQFAERRGDEAPLLAARAIFKRFGTFTANDHVNLQLATGEIHALLGENGAGKSTLVKMLYGLLEPSEGRFAARASRCNSPIRRLPAGSE